MVGIVGLFVGVILGFALCALLTAADKEEKFEEILRLEVENKELREERDVAEKAADQAEGCRQDVIPWD